MGHSMSGSKPVRVGIHPGNQAPYGALSRRVSRMRARGFDSFWWGDHLLALHSRELWQTSGISQFKPDPHVYPDPFLVMAAVAEAAAGAILGTCVTDAVRRMPASLVQTAMTLDQIAPGQVVLGIGSGEYANYGPYGWDIGSPSKRLEESVVQIRRLLDSPEPDENGALVALRPPEGSPGPQLWIAAHGPRSYELTGRYGDGWLPHLSNEAGWLQGRDAILSAAVEAGRDPSAITLSVSGSVIVDEDPQVARKLATHPIVKALTLILPPARFEAFGVPHPLGGNGLHRLVATRLGDAVRIAAEAVPDALSQEHVFCGTPEEIAARLRRFDGASHFILWDTTGLADPSRSRASLEGCVRIAELLRN
jgi:phthiodiolone/phenolphthiodiolone dimycocerosates ketoreductase